MKEELPCMKRLTSFLMVCIMLLGMSAGAFAAGDENASVEGGYTAVTTSNERVRGFYNDNAALKAYKQGYEIEKKETKRDNKKIKAKIKALEAKLNQKK